MNPTAAADRPTRERSSATNVRYDRIARVQASMRKKGLVAIVVMNHDDFRWLFGTERSQPRAIIPVEGPADLVAFSGEEPELRRPSATAASGSSARSAARSTRSSIACARSRPSGRPRAPDDAKPKVGMQMWFETPAFLVDLFRQVNPSVELVSSDPVMDPLRRVKDPDEMRAHDRGPADRGPRHGPRPRAAAARA